jgi:L-amino acid N-acyltransferase YncA
MTESKVEIRAMHASDWPSVQAIYADGIATGDATFETEAPDWEAWNASHLPDLRCVAVQDDVVIGWAAASPVSDRCCYSGVVENSVYVAPSHQGRGVGKVVLAALIEASERSGIWTIQTGIFPENTASVSLQKASGFRIVGRRERGGAIALTCPDKPAFWLLSVSTAPILRGMAHVRRSSGRASGADEDVPLGQSAGQTSPLSPAANDSTSSWAMSSWYCTGGDFMK